MGTEIIAKEKKYEDFYRRLRAKINKWVQNGRINKKKGGWTDSFLQYLMVLPDLVHLVIKMFTDRRVPAHVKGYLLVALAYLISPIDIIPDFIPVAGFVDDLLVIVVMLNKIINSADPELLEIIDKHWAGEENVFVHIKEIVGVMNDLSSQIPRALYGFMKRKD